MRINNNIMAMNTHRQLGITNLNSGKSMEKLSSGYRINRAGDDAAGLAISEKMRGQIRGLNMASRNAQDGISLIQTAEGALSETHAILQRMRELAVQASNDTYEDKDRTEIQKEIDQLKEEIDRIANTTEFNTMKLLNGDRANTKQVAGVNFEGSGDTTVNAASTGLNVKLLAGEDALSVGDHTLEITTTRNTRDEQKVTPLANDLAGTGNGKGVKFAGDAITAGDTALADDWTLEYDSSNNNFVLTNASNTVSDTIEIGQAYNNHGLSFTIDDRGTIADGETLTFSTAGGAEAIGTNVVGWTAGTNKDAVFNGQIVVKDAQELSNYGGGTIEITLDSADSGTATVVVKDKGGNTVITDVLEGAGAYNAHGIEFEITSFGTTDGTDKITINIADDTYKVQASLDGGESKTVIDKWNGINTDAVSGFTGFAGIELNQSAVFADGVFDFVVEQTVTGEDNSLTFQIGSNSNQSMNLGISDMSASALKVDNLSVVDYNSAQAAIDSIEAAIGTVSAERSKLGAVQNRLEHTIKNLDTSSENLQASESRIRDVDMAKEMMEFTKNNILQQAAQAMLAQANQAPQGVLQLLR
jgi:flagellin